MRFWIRLSVFILTFHHLALDLHFKSYFKFNFVLISVFNHFHDRISISISNFDFFVNSNPNLLISNSVIHIGVISLNIFNCIISNLNSLSDLIEFQRYLKKFPNSPWIPYLLLYSSIRQLIFKLVSLDFVLTRDCVYSTTSRVSFLKWHHCWGIRRIF